MRRRPTALFMVLLVASTAVAGPLTWWDKIFYKGNIEVRKKEKPIVEALRMIWFAQERLRLTAQIDEDGDGVGEFGFLAQLGGVAPVTGGLPYIDPGPIPNWVGQIDQDGFAEYSGYYFRMFLPGDHGYPIAEWLGPPYIYLGTNSNMAEQHWVCYAWPIKPKKSAHKAFVINEVGQMFKTVNRVQQNMGKAVIPEGDAAYPMSRDLTAELGGSGASQDGGAWYPVEQKTKD